MTQLSAIDQVTQTFKAAMFIILRFKGGALDNDLVKEYDGFPVDAQGKPTFLPSATWWPPAMPSFPRWAGFRLTGLASPSKTTIRASITMP